MQNLAKTVMLVGALSLCTGAAFGKATQQLHCSTTHCTYTEQLHKSGTTSFQGYCDGTQQIFENNSSMKCHPAKGMTCTFAYIVGSPTGHTFWSCTCTNWSATKKQNATIDINCPTPNQEQN